MTLAFYGKSKRRRGALFVTGFAASLLAVAFAIGLVARQGADAAVTTDQADYAPGSVVTISGDNSNGFGYVAGETITVHVTHDLNDWEANCDPPPVVAANGSWSCTVTLSPLASVAVGPYTYTATRPNGMSETGQFTDASIGLYDQCSNDLGVGYPTGDTGCRWTNGNLQSNNSRYFEGDATVQRAWLTGYEPGTTHTVTFKYGTTKGGKHAYDYLTSWNFSESWISAADRCQDITGCSTAPEITSTQIPADPNAGGFDVASNPRVFTLRGASGATVTAGPTLVSGSYAGDSETTITLQFTVANSGDMCEVKSGTTTCAVAVWFGAHVSRQLDWGAGNSAVNISGSPYHVALDAADGESVGQRDNQMQAGAVVLPGSVVINKVCTSDAADSTFPFTATGTGMSAFSLGCGDTQTFAGIVAGTKTVTETLPLEEDWSFVSLVCQETNSPSSGNTATTVSGTTATIGLNPGETVTCTYTNTFTEPPAATVSVSKTATTTFTRTCAWNIDKAVAEASPVTVPEGTDATFNYTVTATNTGCTDSAWNVSGNITITNTGTVPAIINDVDDSIASAVVTCPGTPFPVTIPVAGNLVCSYTAAMASGAGGNNVATAVVDAGDDPDLEFDSEPVPFSFTTPTTLTDESVDVVDDKTNPGTPVALGSCTVATSPCTFPYALDLPGVAGTCTDYTNIATSTTNDTSTTDTDTVTVRVCVAQDLTVSKTAVPSFGVAYTWELTKDVDQTSIDIAEGGEATFSYTVTATAGAGVPSGWLVNGVITVTNPNNFQAITADITDAINNGGVCVVTNGDDVVVAASSSVNRNYQCTYAAQPAPDPATNTATATWDAAVAKTPTGTDSGTAPVNFAAATPALTDESVDVVDDKTNPGTPVALGSCAVADSPCEFEYALDLPGVAGTCTDYTNVATSTASDTRTTDTDSETVEVCVGSDLIVTKTAVPSYDRAHDWSIDKSVDDTTVFIADDETATFNYTVTVTYVGATDSNIVVTGDITIQNPNDWQAITLTSLADVVNNGGTCALDEAGPYVVPAGDSLVVGYSCTYTEVPDGAGLNTATATWDAALYNTPTGTDSGTANATFGAPTNETDATIHVTDTYEGTETALGTCTAGGLCGPFTYSHTEAGVGGTCTDYNNTAEITETGESSSERVTLCVGVDLVVTKTAAPSYNRAHDWSIDKSVDDTTVFIADDETATFNYTVTVEYEGATDSRIVVGGVITIANPNDWQSITLTSLTDVVNNGGTCVFVDNGPYVIPASDSLVVGYRCTYASVPAGAGTNTATATWDAALYNTPTGTDSGTADATFGAPTNETDATIHVTDTYEGTETALGTCSAPGPCGPFNYSHTEAGVGGTCTDYNNTAEITETGESSSERVTLCVGVDLEVSKTARPSYTREHSWSIDKSSPQAGSNQIEPGVPFVINYTVDVAYGGFIDSRIVVGGVITIANPNDWQSITLTSLTDVVNNGGTCVFVDNGPYVIAANSSLAVGYRCIYASVPAGEGTNTATATWDAALYNTPTGTDDGTANFTFGAPTTEIDKTITVVDNPHGNLGQCTAPGNCQFTYSRTVTTTALGCTTTNIDNTATIVETNQSDSVRVTLDASCVNGKTQGFWGNQNGQALLLLKGFTSTTLGGGSCLVNVTLANSKIVLPGDKKGHNGLSIATGCDAVKKSDKNAFNNLLSQTLALYFNIQYIDGYAGQTINDLNCAVAATGTGLAGTASVNDVLTAANALIASSGNGNVGAFNELLGCLNREAP